MGRMLLVGTVRITIEELDDVRRSTWLTIAVRNANIRKPGDKELLDKWPLVVFSHGSGAFRASYSFWTEMLASYGYVVAACDHPGSARYTIVDGKVITPTTEGARSKRTQIEKDRTIDLVQIMDGLSEKYIGKDKLEYFVDTNNVAITGMSFGGYTTAAILEFCDSRIKAAVFMCAAIAKLGTQDLHDKRKNNITPIMVMIGSEDTVLGTEANNANRIYWKNHKTDAFLLEIKRGGHVSFTSCEMYDPEYGNGIACQNTNPSLDGSTYKPLEIQKQHEIINHYGLAFLNKYLKATSDTFLETNHYSNEAIYKATFNSNADL